MPEKAIKAPRHARPDSCLHCVLMIAIEDWFEHHGERRDGQVIIDVVHAVAKLTECAAEIADMTKDRSQRRRAMRFAHESLDAAMKSIRTRTLQPVDIPPEN